MTTKIYDRVEYSRVPVVYENMTFRKFSRIILCYNWHIIKGRNSFEYN